MGLYRRFSDSGSSGICVQVFPVDTRNLIGDFLHALYHRVTALSPSQLLINMPQGLVAEWLLKVPLNWASLQGYLTAKGNE